MLCQPCTAADPHGAPPPPTSQADAALLREVESYQKTLVSRYVSPIMSGMSLLFYLAYCTLEPRKLAAFAIGMLFTVLNIYLTRSQHARSDLVDCIRWLANLIIGDVILAVGLRPSAAAFVSVWLILVISAQADTFRRPHRLLVVGVGLTTGAALLAFLFPEMPLRESMLIMFCMTGVILMLSVAETYWLREIAIRTESRRRELEAAFHADRLKQEALVGHYMQIASHELGNMLGILDMATEISGSSISGAELAMVRRAIDYSKKINKLVLGQPGETPDWRRYNFGDLIQDIELLLGKEVARRGIRWLVVATTGAARATFEERGGSTYFILHNLVKNAWEAFEMRPPAAQEAPRITVEASLNGADLEVCVADNAGGMAAATRSAILGGHAATSKAAGHGLGLRFVADECRKNGFRFEVETEAGHGSTFRLIIRAL